MSVPPLGWVPAHRAARVSRPQIARSAPRIRVRALCPRSGRRWVRRRCDPMRSGLPDDPGPCRSRASRLGGSPKPVGAMAVSICAPIAELVAATLNPVHVAQKPGGTAEAGDEHHVLEPWPDLWHVGQQIGRLALAMVDDVTTASAGRATMRRSGSVRFPLRDLESAGRPLAIRDGRPGDPIGGIEKQDGPAPSPTARPCMTEWCAPRVDGIDVRPSGGRPGGRGAPGKWLQTTSAAVRTCVPRWLGRPPLTAGGGWSRPTRR